ncbi:cache domain-containing protein [Methanococcoides sp.]|uniref:cache domain-containing protein n=1 Tax=Methanococcoides sp. TaxID=1966350 RepID=UPI00272DD084|nr:cache domain-containing protein [Methanococcoides sp.]
MIELKKVICVLLILVMFFVVAGCVQPDDTGEDEQGIVEEQNELASQREFTVSQVNLAVELIEEEGEQAFPQFREKNGQWFHDDFYIFVWRNDGIRMVYPPNVSREGQDTSNLEDFNGKPTGQLFIDIAQSEEGEGWIDYYWPKPDETEPSNKYTFIKAASFDNQTYLVGSGFYVNDYIYTKTLEDVNYTRFGNISVGYLIHPAKVDRDLDIDYSFTHVIINAGKSIEPHRMKNPEVYYVLEGEGVLYIEDVPFELSKGKLVHIPANSKQYTENTGDVDLVIFVIDQPAWAKENEQTLE